MIDHIAQVMPYLLRGVLVTLEVTAGAAVIALIMSFLIGAARSSPSVWVRAPAALYVEFFRGTSAFVQIFWVYFALPLFGVTFSPLMAGVVVLGLNVGAYGAEVVRGALLSVAPGQAEAALALNLSRWQSLKYVVGPQALVKMIAPFGNLLIDLVKGTSLLSAIGLVELTFAGKQQVYANGQAATTYALVMVLYLLVGIPLAWGMRKWERQATLRLHLSRVA